MTTPSTPAPRGEDALEACADELERVATEMWPTTLQRETILAIMRRYGLQGPMDPAEFGKAMGETLANGRLDWRNRTPEESHEH